MKIRAICGLSLLEEVNPRSSCGYSGQVVLGSALNRSRANSSIRYLSSNRSQSIHLYFSSAHLDLGAPCIDLCSLPDLVKCARRPTAQHAYSLTCVAHDARLSLKSYVNYSTVYYPRLPVAVIKVAFPYASASGCFEPLTQRELFPTDEPIYRALLSALAPYLVRYV